MKTIISIVLLIFSLSAVFAEDIKLDDAIAFKNPWNENWEGASEWEQKCQSVKENDILDGKITDAILYNPELRGNIRYVYGDEVFSSFVHVIYRHLVCSQNKEDIVDWNNWVIRAKKAISKSVDFRDTMFDHIFKETNENFKNNRDISFFNSLVRKLYFQGILIKESCIKYVQGQYDIEKDSIEKESQKENGNYNKQCDNIAQYHQLAPLLLGGDFIRVSKKAERLCAALRAKK